MFFEGFFTLVLSFRGGVFTIYHLIALSSHREQIPSTLFTINLQICRDSEGPVIFLFPSMLPLVVDLGSALFSASPLLGSGPRPAFCACFLSASALAPQVV